MNYGYAPTPHDGELERQLGEYVKTLPPDKYGMMPYVERDGLYAGVRIRRITHYSDDVINEIVKGAEKIYSDVMSQQKAEENQCQHSTSH